MPRISKKAVPVEERIASVRQEIENLSAKLKKKKDELKNLEAEKMDFEKNRLVQAWTASGLSIDDAVSRLDTFSENDSESAE